jgi:hypothetical protein
MIFVTQDLNSLAPYADDTLSLYSRCGIGDLLILRDYVMPNHQASTLKKCDHCGSFVGADDSAVFRGGKKFLHLRFLKPPIEQRNKQVPNYLHSVVVPFLKKIFPANANIFISLALNPNRPTGGGFLGDEMYFQGFAKSNNVAASAIFPTLPHQNLATEIFSGINISTDVAEFIKTKYICIHTRHRGLHAPDQEFFRSLLFDVIGASNTRIALVGEKTNSCSFHSIHDLCKTLIPKGSLFDFTTDGFSVNNLATDCLISKYAKLCLCFGIGGNVVMNSYAKIPTHTYVDLGDNHPFFNEKNPTIIYRNKYSFMLKIGQLLNSL